MLTIKFVTVNIIKLGCVTQILGEEIAQHDDKEINSPTL